MRIHQPGRRIIAWVVLTAEVWMLITDPIGGHWRAWLFNADKVVGVWLLQVTPIEDFLGIAVVSSGNCPGIIHRLRRCMTS